MKTELKHIKFLYKTDSQKEYDISLSYQLFGKELFTAPIVLVNHALTGNSNVSGENGWWKKLIGEKLIIDTLQYTILTFNIPGNGYDDFFIEDYQDFTSSDIANIFLKGLEVLKISKIFALIGGSLGGSIGWEMLTKNTDLTENFIPIACDFKTHDWLNAQCLVQKFLLETEDKPLEKARIHAMLCYRTPESLNDRFKNNLLKNNAVLESVDWLNFHGKSLADRFSLKSYQLMNHLLMHIKADEIQLKKINSKIYLISVDTDLFFPAFEIKKCFNNLKIHKTDVYYHEIKSIHGHDAFLMEYKQLNQILKPIFS